MVVPQRTCIGCRQARAKKELIRIVKPPSEEIIAVDSRGREKGRGGYVCPDVDCINKASHPERLNRAFRIALDSADCISLEAADRLKQDLLRVIGMHLS